MTAARKLRVMLADDHDLLRAGLRILLEREARFEVVAEAADGRTAVALALKQRPDIAVLDISMAGLNGIEAARQVRDAAPEVRIVALSMHSDRQFVTEMLKAGAAGYLLKSSAASELVMALEAVAAGKTYLSPAAASVVVDTMLKPPAAPESAFATLTAREREVLQLIAEGRTNKEIAQALTLSVKTVETHRGSLMNKLNLRSVAELTKYAVREGLTSL